MKLEVYGLTKCSTCEKAVKGLRALGHEVAFYDVRDDGIDDGVLIRALEQIGERKLRNRASYTWRGLSEAEREGDPLQSLKAHPSLMKRPLIDTGSTLFAGWTKSVITEMEKAAGHA